MTTHSNTCNSWFQDLTAGWRAIRLRRWQQYPVPRLLCCDSQLPTFVRQCGTSMRVREWIDLVDWTCLPPTPSRRYFDRDPVPDAAYIAAFLVKLDQQQRTFNDLRRFLVAHPALVWGLGFPLPAADTPHGFDAAAAVPTARHLARTLRHLPNDTLQLLLSSQVNHLRTLFGESFGQTISLDTKHIIAWIRENNPKAFVKEGRFDKSRQPTGNLDCKLGCKRRRNQGTPTKEGQPAGQLPTSVVVNM